MRVEPAENDKPMMTSSHLVASIERANLLLLDYRTSLIRLEVFLQVLARSGAAIAMQPSRAQVCHRGKQSEH